MLSGSSGRDDLFSRIFAIGLLLPQHALMCLGAWSKLGLVCDADLLAAATLPDVMEDEDEFNIGWDYITYS